MLVISRGIFVIPCDAGGEVSGLRNLWLCAWLWGWSVTGERSNVNLLLLAEKLKLLSHSFCLLYITLITVFSVFHRWSFNFLFYNRKLKRIVTFRFSCFRWDFIIFVKYLELLFVCVYIQHYHNAVCGSNLIADGFLVDGIRNEEDEEIFADMDMWVNTASIMLAYQDYRPHHV